MSTTVKVFIVLIVIASLGVAFTNMVSYATRENWKRRWNEDTTLAKQQVEIRDQKLADVTLEMVKAQYNVSVLAGAMTDLQAKMKVVEDEKGVLQQEINLAKTEAMTRETKYTALKEDYEASQQSLSRVRQRNTELASIAQVARAVAHSLNIKLAEVEDDLNNTQTELTKRAEDMVKLDKELREHKAIVALLRERFPKVYTSVVDEKASDKYLNSVVAAVRVAPNGQQDLVMLKIGIEEGVAEGIEFIVYRGNQYICKVRVEKVMKDMAACRVITESWNQNSLQIQQGDSATNRL